MAPAKRRGRAPVVVAVGGSDPSAGAGIQADVRTIEAMGATPMTVITALTLQDGTGVRSVRPVPARWVEAELRLLLRRFDVAAVKCGQLPTAATVAAVARALAGVDVALVVDPVVEASGGGRLAAPSVTSALERRLLPMASVVTVNLDEAALLAGFRVRTLADARKAARAIGTLGAGAVVVKGGHLRGRPCDVLWDGTRIIELSGSRLRGSARLHGGGCAFASAIAARLACGDTLATAVDEARVHVRALLVNAAPIAPGRLLRQPSRRRGSD